MADYTLTQTEFRNAKTRLTRVLNAANRARLPYAWQGARVTDLQATAHRNAWQSVVNECNRAAALFRAKGFPDSWHRWRMAFEDAATQLNRDELRCRSMAVFLRSNPFDN